MKGVMARHDELFTALWIELAVTAAFSFGSFVVGYLLSVLWRLPRHGRAFECVYFFTSVIGGVLLIFWALDLWDRQRQLPGMFAAILLGLIGLVVFYTGFISSVARYQRHRQREA
jgi:uncharacterized membrane protein YeaQ/YmgE (transglycosylase-associated protein family)